MATTVLSSLLQPTPSRTQRSLRALSSTVGRDLERVRADRVTVTLAGIAAATAGTVIAGEIARLARRRRRSEEATHTQCDPAIPGSPAFAGQATQDTINVAIEGYGATPRNERILFNMLTGFVGSFAAVRLSTAGIRAGWWPLGNVRIGDRHIHHFVPGILVAFASGAAAILTPDLELEEKLALPFGVGVGLTFDEAALLLDLRDVYWSREGLLSVQVSLGIAGLLGGTILALRILRRGEREVEDQGGIPFDPAVDWPVAKPTGSG